MPPTSFELPHPLRIRREILARIGAGRFLPGAPIGIAGIADALGVSPTPVREALCHLAGEGLVTEDRRRGFAVRRLESDELVAYYGLRLLFLAEACRSPTRAAVADPINEPVEWFDALVLAVGNVALVDGWRNLRTTLLPYVEAERTILAGLRQKWCRGDDSHDRNGHLRAIKAYHRVCQSQAGAIAARASRNIDGI
jgi:hypothetical protein